MQQCWRRIGGQRRSELLGSSRRRDAASPDSWYFSITAAGLRQCIACHVGWRVVWWCRSSCHWVALRTRGVLVGGYGAHGLACGHGHVQGSRLGTAWPASPVSSVGQRACSCRGPVTASMHASWCCVNSVPRALPCYVAVSISSTSVAFPCLGRPGSASTSLFNRHGKHQSMGPTHRPGRRARATWAVASLTDNKDKGSRGRGATHAHVTQYQSICSSKRKLKSTG